MHLDIEYMQVRSKNYVSSKPKASHNLKQGIALQSAHVWNELRLLEAGLCNITCAELIPVYGRLLACIRYQKANQTVHMLQWCFKCIFLMFYLFLDVCCKFFYLDVAYTCMLQAYISSFSDVSYVCCKGFFRTLHMFCNGYTRVFLVF
jgi:hypothetical protein